jgi:hypothetical protein
MQLKSEHKTFLIIFFFLLCATGYSFYRFLDDEPCPEYDPIKKEEFFNYSLNVKDSIISDQNFKLDSLEILYLELQNDKNKIEYVYIDKIKVIDSMSNAGVDSLLSEYANKLRERYR